jgi:hypothetical protein
MGRPAAPIKVFTCPTCGGEFQAKDKAERRRYCSSPCQPRGIHRGKDNSSFRGGVTFKKDKRRWAIVCRDRSTEYFARAVMSAHLRRALSSDEIVHHINGDATDDRIENLEVVTRSEHRMLHHRDLMRARGLA